MLHFASNTCASTSQGKEQIPDVEVEEDNETLMEVGYGEDENIGASLSGKFSEEFNKYVPNDESVALQQPCEVVQYPNQTCQLVVDVKITSAFQMKKKRKKREESRNHRHSINEKILLIIAQQVKQNNSIENRMLDTREEESKWMSLIVENTIHSLATYI